MQSVVGKSPKVIAGLIAMLLSYFITGSRIAFQTGFVATIVPTTNSNIAAIKSINAPQELQQAGLTLNDSDYASHDHQLTEAALIANSS